MAGQLSRVPRYIRETHGSDPCPVDGCDVERFSRIGMDYHLIRDHPEDY